MDLDGVCVRKEMVGGRLVLVPADEHAAGYIAKLPEKKDVIVSVRSPRSPDHHRFFFKYLSRIIEHTDGIWSDVEELLEAIKFAVGHTVRSRRIVNPHAHDIELANEIAGETLLTRDEYGNYHPVSSAKTAKIIMALRRGADEYVTRPKSINFASLSEDRFKEFHDKAVLALNASLGWDTSQLMRKENDAP